METNRNERIENPSWNIKQVMFFLGCSRSYLDKLRREGKLRPYREGNRWKFTEEQVKRYREDRQREAQQQYKKYKVTFLNFLQNNHQ